MPRSETSILSHVTFARKTARRINGLNSRKNSYDPAEDLADDKDQVELLAEAFASGDQKFIAAALGAVARARGMFTIAEKAGVTRPALYKALSQTGDPQLSTLLGVVYALGLKLAVEPLAHSG